MANSKRTKQTINIEAELVRAPRRLKTPEYKRWHFQKRIKYPGPKLISSWQIFRRSLVPLRENKKLYAGILAVYVVLSLLLVRGFSNSAQLSNAKVGLTNSHKSVVTTSTTLVGNLFGSSSSNGAVGSTYRSLLFLLMSLVIIWALRQTFNKDSESVSIKAAFYESTGQLVPFILVLLVISLQFIPMVIGTGIYGAVIRTGLAISGPEKLLWSTVLFLFSLASLYMLTASLFAIYIVTLTGVKPLQALRSAKQLVRLRRWTVMRKILFLPVILFVLLGIIMLPIVLLLTGVAEWIFFIFGLAMLIFGHSYLYALYRELM